ncbi:MAG: hypothetical protein AAB463_00335 [Patescibacteria group bacterium]
MNQKVFANILLIILAIVLVGALGYITLAKKPVPTERPQVMSPPSNTKPASLFSSPVGIVLPSGCKIVGSEGDIDPQTNPLHPDYTLRENDWLVDCGLQNRNASEILKSAFEQQGWKLCQDSLSNLIWSKNGTGTVAWEIDGVHPFRILQLNEGAVCGP